MIPWNRDPADDALAVRKVWVSRHARTTANESGQLQGWEPFDLSPSGEADLVEARRWWSERPITWVISSPILRALRTADLLFGRVDDIDAGWSEQATPDLAGIRAAEAHARYPEIVQLDGWSRVDAPRHRAMEHIATVEARAIGALRHAAATPVPGDVAVVTHGAVLVALVRAAGHEAASVGNLAVAEIVVDPVSGWALSALHNPLD